MRHWRRGPADVKVLTPERGRRLAHINHDVLHRDQPGLTVGPWGKEQGLGPPAGDETQCTVLTYPCLVA